MEPNLNASTASQQLSAPFLLQGFQGKQWEYKSLGTNAISLKGVFLYGVLLYPIAP